MHVLTGLVAGALAALAWHRLRALLATGWPLYGGPHEPIPAGSLRARRGMG